MMQRSLDAVYEDGVLYPLETLDLAEHQRVPITVSSSGESGDTRPGEDALNAWLEVYDGLSAEDMAEVEAIALDCSR